MSNDVDPALMDRHIVPDREGLEDHQQWVWMGGATPPHWQVRGTGALLPEPEAGDEGALGDTRDGDALIYREQDLTMLRDVLDDWWSLASAEDKESEQGRWVWSQLGLVADVQCADLQNAQETR